MSGHLVISADTFDRGQGTLTVNGHDVLMCHSCRFFLELMVDGEDVTGVAVPCAICAGRCGEAAAEATDMSAALRALGEDEFTKLASAMTVEYNRRNPGR